MSFFPNHTFPNEDGNENLYLFNAYYIPDNLS